MSHGSIHPRWNGHRLWRTRLVLAALLTVTTLLQAQSYYDFDNGTNTGWLTSTLHPSTITFPRDVFGGHALRLQGAPMTSGSDTNARVFAIWTNRLYTNFYASVDIVSWNTNQDCEQVVGILGRVNSNQALPPSSPLYAPGPLDPEVPTGMSFNARLHDYRSYTGPGNAGPLGAADQMSAWGIVNAFGTFSLGNPVTVTETRFRWVPGHAYRLVLSCTNAFGDSPTYFTASIYDVNDLTAPLLTMTGDDSYSGNSLYIPLYGYVGLFAYKLANADYDPTVDVTFDNFYVGEVPPPTVVAAPGVPHGKIGAPQIVSRVPGSFKNFHPAANGISFNATTLTTTNPVSSIQLFLNGVDVSGGLAVAGPATNAYVAFGSLVSNSVYNARIVLQDAFGRRTTNDWVFDTFSDAYLASAAVKVVEVEDYDFNGGSFINDPPASGYYDYDPVADTGTLINSGAGYVDQTGINDLISPPGDFFSYDGSPRNGDSQYRHSDSVGTQQGNYGAFVYADTTLVSGIGSSLSYDTQRSKYSSLNPTLQEYIVERTQGGEWFNYTRVFNGTPCNAYLRAAGGLAQPIRLDQIAAGPQTNLLGRFNVPSTFYNHHYIYVPLVAPDGSPAVISLSGTNTIRLTIDSPQNNATQYGLSLNLSLIHI